MKAFLFSLLIICNGLLSSQGLTWQRGEWTDFLEKAVVENKLIFLDFYTDWCAPCRQMDKDIFPDPSVGSLYNDHFIAVKVDAEDNAFGSDLAHRYGVGSYPTLVFVDSGGGIIASFIGQKSKYELIQMGQQVIALNAQSDLINEVKADIYGDYTKEELKNILGVSAIHHFPGKEHLVMKYLDQISTIDEEDLRLVMGEVSHLKLSQLQRLAPITASLSYNEMYLRKNSKEWIAWRASMERAVFDHLNRYKSNNDLVSFEKTIEILRGFHDIKPRRIDQLYLDFYRQNDLEQYRTSAIFLIEKYIASTNPEEVKEADRKKYDLLQQEFNRDLQSAVRQGRLTSASNDTPGTGVIDSLSEIYTISKGIADQLYDISGDFFAFYDDDYSKAKAAHWSSLSHRYYPYAWKYFDNNIYILEAIGQIDDAQMVRASAKALPWYEEMMARSNSF